MVVDRGRNNKVMRDCRCRRRRQRAGGPTDQCDQPTGLSKSPRTPPPRSYGDTGYFVFTILHRRVTMHTVVEFKSRTKIIITLLYKKRNVPIQYVAQVTRVRYGRDTLFRFSIPTYLIMSIVLLLCAVE